MGNTGLAGRTPSFLVPCIQERGKHKAEISEASGAVGAEGHMGLWGSGSGETLSAETRGE